jgi:hypothetical protein
MKNKTPLTRIQFERIGFRPQETFTVTGNLIYDIGRGRQLSVGCAGTPNEIMFLAQLDGKSMNKVSDAIVLSNYDYDGYLTVEKLQSIIAWFKLS